jgi:hypothetical protein
MLKKLLALLIVSIIFTSCENVQQANETPITNPSCIIKAQEYLPGELILKKQNGSWIMTKNHFADGREIAELHLFLNRTKDGTQYFYPKENGIISYKKRVVYEGISRGDNEFKIHIKTLKKIPETYDNDTLLASFEILIYEISGCSFVSTTGREYLIDNTSMNRSINLLKNLNN